MVGKRVRVTAFSLCLLTAFGCSRSGDEDQAGPVSSLGGTVDAVESTISADGGDGAPSALPVVVVQGDGSPSSVETTDPAAGTESTTGSTSGKTATSSDTAPAGASQQSTPSSDAPTTGSTATTAGRTPATIRVAPSTSTATTSGRAPATTSTTRATTTTRQGTTATTRATPTTRRTTTTSGQATTTTRRSTTTQRNTTTTARPATTTTTTRVTTRPTTPVGGRLFFEDFSGSGSMGRFDIGLYHRDDHVVANNNWFGDHASTGPGDLCGAPEERRQISRGERNSGFNMDWAYRCVPGGDLGKAHMMTAIGDTSGYSIGAFAPSQSFTGVREVRWDVNITDLGLRQFTEIKIIPSGRFDFQALPCAKDLPCNTPEVGEIGAVAVSFFNHKLHIHNGSSLAVDHDEWFDMYGGDPALSSIRTRRTMFFRDNGNNTLTYGVERENGSFHEMTTSGRFPSGSVRVVFGDHNYTPNKGEPSTFTWHWDNIEVRG